MRTLCLLLAALLLAGCAGTGSVPAETLSGITPAAAVEAETGVDAPVAREAEAGALEVVFFNVGRADSLLLRAGGSALLLDTGTRAAAPRLLGNLRALGVTALDAVILTHSHKDHIGGLEILAENLPIGQIYCSALGETNKNGVLRCQKAARDCGLPVTLLQAGETLPFGDTALDVLGPLVTNVDDDNDNSLVLGLNWEGTRWLFTGDMQFAGEKALLDAGIDLAADVLKVGNHGNPDATSPAFAAAVSPRLAVISTNTAEDTNSANPRVIALLSPAEVYLTQDAECGWRLTQRGSDISIDDPPIPPAAVLPVTLYTDAGGQTVTVTAAVDADLSGWMLLSREKGSLFVFPEGTRLTAGSSLTVSGEKGGGDLLWSKKKPLKAGGDTVLLLGPWGRLP